MNNNGISPVHIKPADPRFCNECGSTPCQWVTIGQKAVKYVEHKLLSETNVPHATFCYHTYKAFTFCKFGMLGKYERIKIPPCVIQNITDKWPDPDGIYKGFQPSNHK